MERILKALLEVFPDFNKKNFTSDLTLGSINNYDSMNAVNFFVSLENEFGSGIAIDEMPLDKANKIGDIVAYLNGKGIFLEN